MSEDKKAVQFYFTYEVPIPITLFIIDYIVFNPILFCLVFVVCFSLFVFKANKSLLDNYKIQVSGHV